MLAFEPNWPVLLSTRWCLTKQFLENHPQGTSLNAAQTLYKYYWPVFIKQVLIEGIPLPLSRQDCTHRSVFTVETAAQEHLQKMGLFVKYFKR